MPVPPITVDRTVPLVHQDINAKDVQQLAESFKKSPNEALSTASDSAAVAEVLQKKFSTEEAIEGLTQLLENTDPSTSEAIIELANKFNVSPLFIAAIAIYLKSDTTETVAEKLQLQGDLLEQVKKDLNIQIAPKAVEISSRIPTKTIMVSLAVFTAISAGVLAYRNKQSIMNSSAFKLATGIPSKLATRISTALSPKPTALSPKPIFEYYERTIGKGIYQQVV